MSIHRSTGLNKIVDSLVNIYTSGNTIKIRILQNTLLLIISKTGQDFCLFGAATELDVMILYQSSPRTDIQPVGIYGRLQLRRRISPVRVPRLAVDLLIQRVLQIHIILCIDKIERIIHLLSSQITTVRDFIFTRFSSFRRNQYDTIRPTCSINSRGRRIFQYLHGLNIIRVQIQAFRRGETIHYIKRFICRRD